MKTCKKEIRVSGSIFSTAQKCPASLTFDFSKKLMAERDDAQAGTDAHADIAADIESVRRFLPKKTPGMQEHIEPEFSGIKYKGLTLGGGVDYWSFDPKTGHLNVTDWKTGPLGIDHLGADQVLFYAFLILLRGLRSDRVKAIELVLVAPGLNQKKIFTVSVDDVMSVQDRLDGILAALKRKDKPVPGEHCRWCNARFFCPQLKEEIKRFAEPRFQGKLTTLTADDLRTLTVAARVIEDIRNYAKELIENGVNIPGVRLETQNAARVFVPDVDVKELARLLDFKPDSLMETKLRSPASLEKSGAELDKVSDFIMLTTRKVLKVEKADISAGKPAPRENTKTTKKVRK